MSSKSNPTWTKKELYEHLQAAINVEFFTIPLYLTAAYSIKPSSRGSWKVLLEGEDDKKNPISEEYSVFGTVLSVAIQEMYHLMWICNVAKSVGMPIKVEAPDFSKLPTTLHISDSISKNYKGVGSLGDVIDLLVAIETPDTKYIDPDKPPVDPDHPITDTPGPTTPDQDSYDSIGDMYHALAYGLSELWDDLHDSSYNAYQKVMIKAAYPEVPNVTSLPTAMNAIGAICEQGEGTNVDGYIPAAYIPTSQEYADADRFSHYERFIAIQKALTPENIAANLYTSSHSKKDSKDQKSLTQHYSELIQRINISYTIANDVLGTPGMDQLTVDMNNLFAAGITPDWIYNPNVVTPPVVELHICQGLNSCKGHGADGSGTEAGNGDCATVSHVCQGANNCRGQGACGFPGSSSKDKANSKDTFIPGANACSGLGGCQAPISVYQVFASGPLEGKYVWCTARKLFEERMNKVGLPFADAPAKASAVRQKKGTVKKGTVPLKSCLQD